MAMSSHSYISLFQSTSEGKIHYFITISYNHRVETQTQYDCVQSFKDNLIITSEIRHLGTSITR